MLKRKDELSDNFEAPPLGEGPGNFAQEITQKISEEMIRKNPNPKEKDVLSDEFKVPGRKQKPGNFAEKMTQEISRLLIQDSKKTWYDFEEKAQHEDMSLRGVEAVMEILKTKDMVAFETAKVKVHEYFANVAFKVNDLAGVLWMINRLIDRYLQIRDSLERGNSKRDEIHQKIGFLRNEKDYFRGLTD